MRSLAWVLLLSNLAVADLVEHPDHGIRLERGFSFQQFSDENLANDIWTMTINPRGEVVVSGPGYISTLLDTDKDGRADRAERFATTKGAMGLAFDPSGKQVLVMGDGWLSEYRDENLDRIADGPPRKILPFQSGEHGGHAIKRGPDGWWWVLGGNDAGFSSQHDSSNSYGRKPSAGALLRISPDLGQSEIFADGFRNPYDFAFNDRGEVFTFDSDCERDYFLPWYSGCRVYHIQRGRHHGWRLPGHLRSFRVPDYMPETVLALADLGRGSPTGVLCYQGANFPGSYRNGLLVCDWTFGKIHHLPLISEDGGYSTRPEVFLEPIGTHGFAPTAITEAPDGSIYVSIGGRKTRGAVYRIAFTGPHPETAPAVLGVRPPPTAPVLLEIAEFQKKLGGWKLEGASAEAFVPYEHANPKGLSEAERNEAVDLAQRSLFQIDPRITTEASRLLAMLEDDATRTTEQLLTFITETSTPTEDFHVLACVARLRAPLSAEQIAKTAAAILDLDRKLAGGDRRPKQQWPVRLNEVVRRLFERESALASAVFQGISRLGHLPFVELLPKSERPAAARRFLALAQESGDFAWSPELVELVGTLPEARPALRAQWKNLGLRKALRTILAKDPSPEDRALLAEVATPAVPVGNVSEFSALLEAVSWDQGDPARGAKVFTERACATCHAGASPLGPELTGPVARLSPKDLMVDIQFPSRNISDAFRSIVVSLKDGSQRSGFVIFNSADGVMLQTAAGVTERLSSEQIVAREPSAISMMPPGLLSGLKREDLADLYAYLRTLKGN